MNSWGQFDPNSPIQRGERGRRRSHYFGFVIASACVILFATLEDRLAPLVAVATLVSITPGLATFRGLIGHSARVSRIARVGLRRTWVLVLLGGVFAGVIVVQLIVGMLWGGWFAAAIVPVAYLIEFLIARELVGESAKGDAKGSG